MTNDELRALDIRWLRNVANAGRGSTMTSALHAAADEIERLTAERDKATYHLRNLLAVIHEDKGSYTATYGIEASVQDAFKRVSALRNEAAMFAAAIRAFGRAS